MEVKKRIQNLYAESTVSDDSPNVWSELVDLQSSVSAMLKKYGIGYDVKTFDEEKGATAKLRSILRNLFTSGQAITPSKIKTQLNEEVVKYSDGSPNYAPYEIERIARTEASSLREVSKLLRWREMGFKKVKHIARIDSKTGKKDEAFNGRIFGIEFLLKNQNDRIPIHPNCRCTYVLEE